MKHLTKLILTFSSLALILTFCKGPQTASNQSPITTNQNASNTNKKTIVDLDLPCTGSDFFSDNDYLRASQSSQSIDMTQAKKAAIRLANAQLAQDLEAAISSVADDWAKQVQKDDDLNYSSRMEDMTRTVVEEVKLSKFNTICEKMQQNAETGRYISYVSREVAAIAVAEEIDDQISKDEVLRIDYDYDKFKNQFNEEMERRRENNN